MPRFLDCVRWKHQREKQVHRSMVWLAEFGTVYFSGCLVWYQRGWAGWLGRVFSVPEDREVSSQPSFTSYSCWAQMYFTEVNIFYLCHRNYHQVLLSSILQMRGPIVSIEGSRLESGIKAQVSMTQDSGSLLYPFLKHFNACFFLHHSWDLSSL